MPERPPPWCPTSSDRYVTQEGNKGTCQEALLGLFLAKQVADGGGQAGEVSWVVQTLRRRGAGDVGMVDGHLQSVEKDGCAAGTDLIVGQRVHDLAKSAGNSGCGRVWVGDSRARFGSWSTAWVDEARRCVVMAEGDSRAWRATGNGARLA